MVTGRPCIDFLDNCEKWNESNKLYMILVTIQVRFWNVTVIMQVFPSDLNVYIQLCN